MLLDSSVSGLFKWRQFEPEVILLAVGWYLRFSLSYCDVEPDSKPWAIWPTIAKHRPVQYLNNVLEQDHRAIKRRVKASQHFR